MRLEPSIVHGSSRPCHFAEDPFHNPALLLLFSLSIVLRPPRECSVETQFLVQLASFFLHNTVMCSAHKTAYPQHYGHDFGRDIKWLRG